MLLYIDVYLYLHKIYYTIEKYTIDYIYSVFGLRGIRIKGARINEVWLYVILCYIYSSFVFTLGCGRPPPPPADSDCPLGLFRIAVYPLS